MAAPGRWPGVPLHGDGRLNGHLQLKSAQNPATASAADNRLEFAGTLANKLRHAAVLLLADDPVVAKGSSLRFSNCTTLTLVLDAATDFKPDHASGWRSGVAPLEVARQRVANAAWATATRR